MQKVKTLFIFTFMVVILYGAYHVLYREASPPPQEVIEAVAEGGAEPLNLELGTEVSADQLLADLNNNTPLVNNSLEEQANSVTAADDGQFESPAAGQLDLEAGANSFESPLASNTEAEQPVVPVPTTENPLVDTVDPVDTAEQAPATETSTNDSQFVLEPNVNTTDFPLTDTNDSDFQPAGGGEDAFSVTESGSVAAAANTNDAFPLADGGADIKPFNTNVSGTGNQSQLEEPLFNDGNVSPANSITEQNPVPASSAFATAWAAAQQQVETGHLREALQALSAYYGSTDLSAQQAQQLLPVLDYLAGEVVYSRKHYLFEAYTVGPNDSLESIAFQLRVPAQLLANINGIRDTATLKAGDELKIVQGPFRGEIRVATKELTLFVGTLYAGRFKVELGNEFNSQPGQYSILDKQLDRSYYAADGSIIQGGAVNNPYGKYWLDLGGNISIHTQPQDTATRQSGLGSVKLNPVDARDVYHILSAGSQVIVR